uniref:Uncharacterized protein n=1 Tax=Arion vulgaris TaxID=1028688 RepID=A0A0B6Y0U0_9EUPU
MCTNVMCTDVMCANVMCIVNAYIPVSVPTHCHNNSHIESGHTSKGDNHENGYKYIFILFGNGHENGCN